MEEYEASGATLTESVTDANEIYKDAHGDSEYTKAVDAIIKAIAENDEAKVLTTLEGSSAEEADDFQKIALMTQELAKKPKVRELATIMETAVEIYQNINDNVGQEILNLLNETVIIYDNDDFDAIMDSVNTIINNCEFKEEVFAVLAQYNQLDLNATTINNFLIANYSGINELDEGERALISSTARSILSVLENTGDKGKLVLQIIEKAFNVYSGKDVISNLIAIIVDNSNDEELRKEYRSIVNIMQINKTITQISTDDTLTDAEKYKYTQEEQIKLYKAISIAAKAINEGKEQIDAIEKAYGETTNIEARVFAKFQDVAKDLSQSELEQLTQSLTKSPDIETTLEIVNTEYLRNNLKGDSEKAKTFTEILEDRAALYDTTPYTQFDRNYNILSREDDADDVYYMDNRNTGSTISIGGVVWKDGHSGLQNDYDGIRTANENGYLEKGIEGVKVTLIEAATGEIGEMVLNGEWVPTVTYTDEG